MFHHRLDENIQKRVFLRWYLLSFLAGNVNAGGFLAAERFVSHVTGFATLFGVDAALGRFDRAIGILSVPIFFLTGAIISAIFVDRRYQRGQRPKYQWVMALVFCCLLLVAFAGHNDMFGVFGARVRLKEDYFLLALLCMASGLQNAAITSASGATVRTTHLTGLTTDLGIGIVRVMSSKKNSVIHRRETRANWLRSGSILFFILGSIAGAYLFLHLNYLGFLLPAALALYATLRAWKEDVQEAKALAIHRAPAETVES